MTVQPFPSVKSGKFFFLVTMLAVIFCAAVSSGALWSYSGTGPWLPASSYLSNLNSPGGSAVPMEAMVSESPAQITLKIYSAPTNSGSYNPDLSGTYDVFRKDPDAKSWGSPVGTVTVGTNSTTWVDSSVVEGQLYEYGLAPAGTKTFRFGNVLAGIKVDRTLSKGRMAVVVAEDIISRLPAEYAQYKQDLVLDGWTVHEIVTPRAPDYLANGTGAKDTDGVPSGPFPTNHIALRNQIKALYNTYSNELKNVVLLGKVPVARSGVGYVGPDGHGNRSACGADAYYADMDGVWTDTGNNFAYYSAGASRDSAVSMGTINIAGDNKFDADEMSQLTPNKNLELGFGRIDFSPRISGEYESTRTYFNKLHRYKTASPDFLPGRRAIMRSSFGAVTMAYLAAMPGVLGMTNLDYIVSADLPTGISDDYDDDSAYTASNRPYLFYFKGSGGPGFSDGGQAVFWTGMQSHWGYWFEPAYSSGQTRMQQRLAEDNFCLSFTWYIGNYGWDCSYLYHRLGMGGDAGDMMRASMSDRNSTNSVYLRTDSPMFMNHMGDPALRVFMLAPPTGLQVRVSGGTPALAWTASVAPSNEPPVIGYHVYRSASPAGPFTRLTSGYLTGTAYADPGVNSGIWYYQVKAVRLETAGGGTFYNTSLAAQQKIDLTNGPDPLSVDTNSVLPGANSNTAYTATLTAIGGTPTFTWTVISNALPPGLTLSSSGLISGKPSQAGTFNFTVQAEDLLGQTAQAERSITVQPADARILFPEAGAYTSKSSPTYVARYYEPGMQILGGPTYVYDGLLRFDLSGVPANRTVVRAQLILTVDGTTPSNCPVIVQAGLNADSSDNWSEVTVNYDTRPADNTAVPAVSALSNALPYSKLTLDVTGLAAASLNGDPGRKLGVRLFTATPGSFGQAAQICTSHANRLARPQLILETSDEPPPPFAGFSASPVSGSVPLPVTFTDNSIGSITNRFWNFGDGFTTNTTATNVIHTYTSAGTSTVQLIVSGPLGSSTNTQINLISVTPPAPPSAGFTLSTNAGTAPLTVTFTDTSTGSITNRAWSFGDGAVTNTTAVSIAHTYTVAGTNTVQLIVSGPAGASTNTQINAVTVAAPKVGQLVVYDSFSDAVSSGAIPSNWVCNTPGTGEHSRIVSGSLSYPGLPDSAGNSWGLAQGTADYERPVNGITGLVNGDHVYYSFLIRLNSPLDLFNSGYFRLYNTASASGSGLVVGWGSSDYTQNKMGFSLSNRNRNFAAAVGADNIKTEETYTAADTVYLVVLGYNRGANAAGSSIDLWINPAGPSFGATPPASTLHLASYVSGYSLEATWNRIQFISNGSGAGVASWQVDEFRIATDWANAVPAAASGGGTDDDHDGLPNEWETQYFGGATNANPNAAAANGVNTIMETFVAGLNPTNPSSVFLISDLRPLTSGNILRWNSVSGRVYSVYRTTNLFSSFQPLETNILWPQNSWTGLVNGSQADFYKLKVHLK